MSEKNSPYLQTLLWCCGTGAVFGSLFIWWICAAKGETFPFWGLVQYPQGFFFGLLWAAIVVRVRAASTKVQRWVVPLVAYAGFWLGFSLIFDTIGVVVLRPLIAGPPPVVWDVFLSVCGFKASLLFGEYVSMPLVYLGPVYIVLAVQAYGNSQRQVRVLGCGQHNKTAPEQTAQCAPQIEQQDQEEHKDQDDAPHVVRFEQPEVVEEKCTR